VPWFDYDQPEPRVALVDGVPTAYLAVHGPWTAEWRKRFDINAEVAPRARAIETDGVTVLEVPVPSATAVNDVLNAVTVLLGDPTVPPVPPRLQSTLVRDDEIRTITLHVAAWWAMYKAWNLPN